MLISTIDIVDINNKNCWYQELALLISTIRVVDINNYVKHVNSAINRLAYVRKNTQLNLYQLIYPLLHIPS